MHMVTQKKYEILDALNNGAADSFEDYSRREHDLLQENFRPVAKLLGVHGKLFECHPYMKKRYMRRMSDFYDIISPRYGTPMSQLNVTEKKFPTVHVDVAKYFQLLMKSDHLKRCVQARQEELEVNRRELAADSAEWQRFLEVVRNDDVIEVRLVMDNAVMYSRSKKQREFDQCAVYLYLSMFGLPSSWITLVMFALFEGGDTLLNFIAHCHGSFKAQVVQIFGTGMCVCHCHSHVYSHFLPHTHKYK